VLYFNLKGRRQEACLLYVNERGIKMLTRQIKAELLELNVVDKIHLIEILLDSLDKTNEQIEKVWVKESEKRYHAYKKGYVKGIPLERLRARIKK
jgi:putative addiction module component (TIGR02574 family)